MTRSQRRWHVRLWYALGPLILAGLIVAVRARPMAPVQPRVVGESRAQPAADAGATATLTGAQP